MGKLFDIHLAVTPECVQVRHPVATCVTIILPSLITLGIMRFVSGATPRGEELWLMAVGLWVGVTCCELGRVLWWSTVTFDRRRGVILRGPMTLARLEDLVVVERANGLVLVFSAGRVGTWRWPLPKMSPKEAAAIGEPLAARLGVPFNRSAAGRPGRG